MIAPYGIYTRRTCRWCGERYDAPADDLGRLCERHEALSDQIIIGLTLLVVLAVLWAGMWMVG